VVLPQKLNIAGFGHIVLRHLTIAIGRQ